MLKLKRAMKLSKYTAPINVGYTSVLCLITKYYIVYSTYDNFSYQTLP